MGELHFFIDCACITNKYTMFTDSPRFAHAGSYVGVHFVT